jgi:hypothetical protein
MDLSRSLTVHDGLRSDLVSRDIDRNAANSRPDGRDRMRRDLHTLPEQTATSVGDEAGVSVEPPRRR